MKKIIKIFAFYEILNPFYLLFCILFWKIFYTKEFVFNLKFRNKKFKFYANSFMDFVSLRETFLEKEYDFKYEEFPKIILDLGANVGDTAIFYSILFPNAKIYAIEPNKYVFEKLVKNTRQFTNIFCHNLAIGNTTHEIEFSFSESHFGGSIIKRERNNISYKIQMYSLTDFVKINNIENIDILKFDIEGAEEFLLQDNLIKSGVKQIVGEIHNDLTTNNINNLIANLNLRNVNKKIISKDRYIIFGDLN